MKELSKIAFLMHQEWHDIFLHKHVNGFRFALPWTVCISFWSLQGLLEELSCSFHTSQILFYICSRLRRKTHQISTLACPTPLTVHPQSFLQWIFCWWTSSISFCQVQLDCICTLIAVTQRNMEVRFAKRVPRGSLAFSFASPLIHAFGASKSEKTSATKVWWNLRPLTCTLV